MDLATIIGIVLSVALVVASIVLGGSPIMFVNIPSALVVVGGTIGATLMRNPLAEVLGTFGIVGKTFSTKLPASNGLINEIIELARNARKNGMLALESAEMEYEFLKKAVSLGVDGVELDRIRSILETEISSMAARHKQGQQILEGAASAAPAFGMIGTLIGLVQMLASLEDPSSIGPAMAVALLTTLYGALIANVVCLPLADKLKLRSKEEVLTMSICLEGVVGMVQGDNPNSIDQRLKAFIAPKLRVDAPKAASAEASAAGEAEAESNA